MKLFKYMSLFAALFILNSCQKNLVELENIGVQTSAVFYNDPQNALAGLNACYSATSKDEYFVFGDIMSDDALKGGSSFFDWVEREYIRKFTANSGNGSSGSGWNSNYNAISRCNEMINAIPKTTFDEKLKTRLIGEAKFLRAYAYSKLVALFGGVPILSEDLTVTKLNVPRSKEEQVYTFIKKDLDDAIAGLPAKSGYDASDVGRITNGAAKALKARVLMQETSYKYNSTLATASGYAPNVTAIWDEVYSLTASIIKSGEYNLVANYATMFEQEGANNEESIFEIQHKTTNNEWGESVGNTTIVQMGNRDDWGWCFSLPTDALFNAFGSKDPRRDCSIYGQESDILYGEKQIWTKQEWTLADESTKSEVTKCRLNRKYALRKSLRHNNHNNQPSNKRVIRYADVLLMHAEAAAYKGLEDEARTYANMIRTRAQNSTLPLGTTLGVSSGMTFANFSGASLPPITASGAALLTAIWKERRLELAMEGIRYFDIVRTGNTASLPAEAAYKAHDGVLPIPVGDVNTFGLIQNKGY